MENLSEVLKQHKGWLSGGQNGVRADLSGADLRSANLNGADLSRADLRGADLSDAELIGADLRSANLSGADLSRADLRGADLIHAELDGANLVYANLSGANLVYANLVYANLSGANLSGANLSGANLVYANLSGADLIGANLSGASLGGAKNIPEYVLAVTSITPEGDLIGWKKCQNGVLVKLLIPASARRSNATFRKCRAEYAVGLEVIGGEFGISKHDENVIYRQGETVHCHEWDENRWNECSGGIHFFLTRYEAEQY